MVFLGAGIREEERRILELTGYFQSVTVGMAPVVVVIASVATFSTHILLGYELTAAQVPGVRGTKQSEDHLSKRLSLIPVLFCSGVHCGNGLQRHDLCSEGHSFLGQVSVGGCSRHREVQGEAIVTLAQVQGRVRPRNTEVLWTLV